MGTRPSALNSLFELYNVELQAANRDYEVVFNVSFVADGRFLLLGFRLKPIALLGLVFAFNLLDEAHFLRNNL